MRRAGVVFALAIVVVMAARSAGADAMRDVRQSPPAGQSGAASQSPTVASPPDASETVTGVRVQGNHILTNDEIQALSGLVVGAPFGPTTLADVTRRLHATGKFRDVDVVKRFASIADPSQILVVILVDEGPVRIEMPLDPRDAMRVVRRNRLTNVMWLPILSGEDGYGLTYGVRLAYPGVGGRRGRLSVPLTWGGQKEAGVEWTRTMTAGPLTRVTAGAAIERSTNPAFDLQDDRTSAWVDADRAWRAVRATVYARRAAVTFANADDQVRFLGARFVVDTRLDPAFPRNAVFVSTVREHVAVKGATSLWRSGIDARAYLGVFGQSVIAVRGFAETSDHARPAYLKALVGGSSTLRGFRAGFLAGDAARGGSLELLVPVSSPLGVARAGVNLFVDTGDARDVGQSFTRRGFRTGYGAGLWVTATALRFGVSVAHGRGAGTRAHFSAGLTF